MVPGPDARSANGAINGFGFDFAEGVPDGIDFSNKDPAETAATPLVSPTTSTGVLRFVRVPWPSRPEPFNPQPYRGGVPILSAPYQSLMPIVTFRRVHDY